MFRKAEVFFPDNHDANEAPYVVVEGARNPVYAVELQQESWGRDGLVWTSIRIDPGNPDLKACISRNAHNFRNKFKLANHLLYVLDNKDTICGAESVKHITLFFSHPPRLDQSRALPDMFRVPMASHPDRMAVLCFSPMQPPTVQISDAMHRVVRVVARMFYPAWDGSPSFKEIEVSDPALLSDLLGNQRNVHDKRWTMHDKSLVWDFTRQTMICGLRDVMQIKIIFA